MAWQESETLNECGISDIILSSLRNLLQASGMSPLIPLGTAEVEASVRLANVHLHRRIPGAPALTAEHLWYARQWTDGWTEMSFFHKRPGFDHAVEVWIEKPRDGDPTVTVRKTPTKAIKQTTKTDKPGKIDALSGYLDRSVANLSFVKLSGYLAERMASHHHSLDENRKVVEAAVGVSTNSPT